MVDSNVRSLTRVQRVEGHQRFEQFFIWGTTRRFLCPFFIFSLDFFFDQSIEKKSHSLKMPHKQKISLSSSSDEERLTLSMTFDVLNANQDPQNTPFVVKINISVDGKIVNLHLPALNFTTPPGNLDQGISPGGSVATIEGFLPHHLTPVDSIYQSFTLESDQTGPANAGPGYDGYIANDGSIRIVGKGDTVIPAGPQITHAKTVTYILPFKRPKAPKNFALSKGFSQMTQSDNPDIVDQFLDWYRNDIVSTPDGKEQILAWCWADNADTKTTPPYNLNVMTRVGKLETNAKCGETKLKLEEPVVALEVPLGVYCAENSITIDPTNPSNMFFTTLYIDRRSSPRTIQAWVGVSIDGGKHWYPRQLDVPPLPSFRSDMNALYDKFGNIWLISMTTVKNFGFPSNIIVLLSTDKGRTFTVAFQSTNATNPPPLSNDYPQLAFGGDGNGAFAIWWTVDFRNTNTFEPFNVILGYIPISASGVPNPTGARQVTLSATSINNPLGLGIAIASLTVSDDGVVYLWGEPFSPMPEGNHFNTSTLFINPKGINFTDADIIGPFEVAQTNISGFTGDPTNSFLAGFPWQSTRGVSQPCARTMAFDNTRGLLYALVNDLVPWNSTNGTVYLIFSENGGQSWSKPIPISDDNEGSRGIVGMAIDPVTGNLSFNWYDTRGDSTQTSVRFFGTVLLGSEIDEIRGTTEKCPKQTFPVVERPDMAIRELTDVAKAYLKARMSRRYPEVTDP